MSDFGVLLGGVMMAQSGRQPRSPGHQDHRRHRRAARRAQPHPAPQCALAAREPRSAARPAISAASAPNSARAICSDTPSSRIAPCSRWALPRARTPWSPRSIAASAISAPCTPVRRISIPRTSACRPSPLARERGLTFKGSPESITPHPLAEFRRVPMRRLMARLGLGEFNNVGPLVRAQLLAAQGQPASQAARRRCPRFPWSNAATGFGWAICWPCRSKANSAPESMPASTAWSR